MPIMSQAAFNEMPAWLQDIYKQVGEKVQRQFAHDFAGDGGEYHHIPYDQERRLAEPHPDLLHAHDLSRAHINAYRPYIDRSHDLIQEAQGSYPEHYQRYMNPYEKDVIRHISDEGYRQLRENILPELEGRFIKKGQSGSKRHAQLSLKAANDISREVLNRQTNARMQGYDNASKLFNADKARLLESANQLGNLSALSQAGHLADVASLTDQGRYLQQQEQARLDLLYQDFLRERAAPYEAIGQATAALSGVPYNSSQTSYYQTPGTPQLNVLGQIGQLAGNIYGSRMAMR